MSKFSGKAAQIVSVWEKEWPEITPYWVNSEARLRLVSAIEKAIEDQHRKTWALAMETAWHELMGWANLSRSNSPELSKAYGFAANCVKDIACPHIKQTKGE